jgi:hypothetical protein
MATQALQDVIESHNLMYQVADLACCREDELRELYAKEFEAFTESGTADLPVYIERE